MTIEQKTTEMVHYVCGVCHMEASMVVTNVGRLAWLDHMATHADPTDFRMYTWAVVPLLDLDEL